MFEQDETRQWAYGAPQKAKKENVSVIGLPTEPLGEAAVLLPRCFCAKTRPSWSSFRTRECVTDGWLYET